MKKVLFVYDHSYPHMWKDGLRAALGLLEKHFNITYWNLAEATIIQELDFDFILGWGAFNSSVDKQLQKLEGKKGLCIAGNYFNIKGQQYDVLFHETNWYKPHIETHPNIVHAFGVNTDIFKPMELPKLYDVLSVGAFALWKRQPKISEKKGYRMVVGEVQKKNMSESMEIINYLISIGVSVSDMVDPEKLAIMYNMSKMVYIPAHIIGGGERAVLEARACEIPVEIEDDNEKLKELLDCDLYDHHYYANQLKKGIESCL